MELYSHILTPKIKIYTLTEIIFNYFRYNLEALEYTVKFFFTWKSLSQSFYMSSSHSLSAIIKFKPNFYSLKIFLSDSLKQKSFCQIFLSVQFSSAAQSCPTLCNPMNRSTPGLPVHHQLPEFTQTHVHWVGDAIQLSHPLLSPSPALNISQHQDLFKWVSSSHEVAKVLEFQLQHQSFQWTPRTDFP